MSLSYFRSDEGVLQRIRQREMAASYRANVTPTQDFSERLEAFYRAYPDMNAGVMLSLAKAGLDPSSPQVQQIADMAFEKDRRDNVFDKIGSVIGGAKKLAAPLGALGRGLDTALGGVDESILPGAKGAVRTGFVVLESPLQELQTFVRAAGWAGVHLAEEQGDTSAWNNVRNIIDPTRWDDGWREFTEAYGDAGSSSGREMLSAMARGEDVDLGSGFLPAGQVEETVRTRANRLTLKVGDVQFGGPGRPSITPGRAVAASVVEPGSQQYNILSGLVDGGVAWFGDPAAALGGAAKAAKASTRVGRAGRALRSGRGLTGAAEEITTNPGFYDVVDRSLQSRAAEGLGDLVDNVTGRLTGHGARDTVQPELVDQWLTKGGRHVVAKVAETGDFYDLWNATGRKMGVNLTRRLADASGEQEVMDILRPALGTELRDAPEFLGFKVKRANRHGVRLLGEMPGPHLDPDDIDDATEQLDRWLRNAKVTPELRRSAIDRYVRNDDRMALVDTLDTIMGDVADELAGKVRARPDKDTFTPPARARELTRMWGQTRDEVRTYFVDEIAENREAAGVIINGEPLEVQSPFLFTEFLNDVVPLPDAREVRRATSHLGRLVDNKYFETTTGALDGIMGNWKRLTLLRGAYMVRVIGEEQGRMAASGLDSMFAHPVSFIGALLGDEKAVRKYVSKHRQVDVLGEGFSDADEMARALNKGWSGWVDDTVFDRHFTTLHPGQDGYQRAWAQSIGELYHDPIARMVAQSEGNLTDVKDWFFDQQGRNLRKRMVAAHPELATRAGADRYIDTLWEGVQYRTGSDPGLMEAIATGKIGGATKIGKLNNAGRWRIDDEFMAYLDDVVGPNAVKGQRVLQRNGAARLGEVWDNTTGWMFSWLNTKPTNYLSRSPAFRQRYWERIEEMLPHMDDATRSRALAQAEGVVDGAQLKRMRDAKGGANQSLTDLADADTLAKAHALDQTKALLYDLTDRGQFFDTFRLLFPFGEAWREVMTRWAKIGTQNPRALRRGQQIITSARGNGFFHKDINGEEVFTYPFSRQLSKALIGMPVDLNGRVAGLSLMTEVLPGVGPVVQVPAAALVPDDSEWNWLRNFVAPYGEQDYSKHFISSFMPGYLRNVGQAIGVGDERLRNNTIMAVYDQLASSGDYDMSDPSEVSRLFDDARSVGAKLYLLRGATQFFSPTSPLPETLLESEEGDELLTRREVVNDLYRLQDEHGYEAGIGEFIDRYGLDLLRATQGMSKSIAPMLPVSKDAENWVRDNRGVVKDYGLVWGMFAPTDDTDSISYTEFVRQIKSGQRKALTMEQRSELANARVGRYLVKQAEAKLSDKPTTVERQWLDRVKDEIKKQYPGYGRMVSGVPVGADLADEVIPQLRRAIADPRLSRTAQARAASLYLAARDQALAFANELGVETLEAQAAEPARQWLASIGDLLARRHPEFQQMFDDVFSREVEAA